MNCILPFLLLCMCLEDTKGTGKNAEVVYPERIHHHRSKRDLSTQLKEKRHEETLTFRIKSRQEGDLVVELKKDETYPTKLLLRTYANDGTPIHKYHDQPNCFYTGSVNRKRNSHAFISTCSGITGSLDTGSKRYDIEPHDENDGHRFYNVDDEVEDIMKKLGGDDVTKAYDDTTTMNDFSPGEKITEVDSEVAKSVRPYEVINAEEEYIQYLTTNKTRYVEIFITVDHGLYEYYNDTDVIIERVLNAVGQVDKSYSAINIRLVVVALEIQNNGPTFQRSTDGATDLRYFQQHYIKLRQEDGFKNIRIDNAELFSHRSWNDDRIGGMGFVGTMCTASSAAIIEWNYHSISGPIIVFGHEFGHNLGFLHHRSSVCTCLTTRGCFMGGGYLSGRPGFSDCNMKVLATKTYACLNDRPMNPLSSKCGNGIREKDEECDCGTPENCEKNDPCCEPHNCKLKAEAQCNFLNNPECCGKTCQFARHGTMCREASSNCDVPEYCSGIDATCPADRVTADGTHCGESKKLILGTNRWSRVFRELTPRVTGRYFKFVPKHWTKNKQACMKLEIFGCDPSQDSSTVPTPIVTPFLRSAGYSMCLTPSQGTCAETPDGTKLIYKKAVNNSCTDEHMMFIHTPNGTLLHDCSKKKVCPLNNNLVISSSCEDVNSIFTRTEKWSLQHKETERCLTASSWQGPKTNQDVVLKKWCDLAFDNSKFILRNVDCATPVGLENGDIPDSALSAGPTDYYYPVKDIRMNKEGWCSKTKDDGSWVQVDLGKHVEVRYISLQGLYAWISGLYLMYSDNGIIWKYYKESSDVTTEGMNSACFSGVCALTYDHQCQQLWDADASSASDKCWDELNTNSNGYGTCKPTEISPCHTNNVLCGQLQCTSPQESPYYEDYGKNYTIFTIQDQKCSAAKIINSNDEVGVGMVQDGTKCADGKICIEQECKTPQAHGKMTCGVVNGKICAGKGYCMDNGECLCDSGYDPKSNCSIETPAVDGGWSVWSTWSKCPQACGAGKHRRHRFCNNPTAMHHGNDCVGNRVEEEECSKDACLVGRSCKDLKSKMEKEGQHVVDGVYTINPNATLTLKVYCDMTRNGGGWTLLVSSHKNTWTAENLKLRNEDNPDLYNDYSILKYGNELLHDYRIKDDKFQYRLEAESFGRWGGIWEAPSAFDLASSNSGLEDVELLEKFSEWEYNVQGLQKRLPYIYKEKLTTSSRPQFNSVWGTITDNNPNAHPSRWISGSQKMAYPEHVWYWIREGNYVNPRSCLDLMFRGFGRKTFLRSGIYTIEPVPGEVVETFCEFDRHGGGWTLLLKSSKPDGWSPSNMLMRNSNDVTENDYSILELVKPLKGDDAGEKSFVYMIEADGDDQNGGIFSLPIAGSLEMGECVNSAVKPKLVKKFGQWDENIEGIAKYPICPYSVFGTFQSKRDATADEMQGDKEVYGVIVSTNKNSIYMTSYKHPSSIKVWIREGGSRKSCNDLKVHGYHNGKTDYKDGFYMVRDILPVYCDMTTTEKEGWTLLVTSASSGWSKDQVSLRNEMHPSLYDDYSILSEGDAIKSFSNANHFKYMISAEGPRHWGGIWKAPIKYSFTSSSNGLTDVELITKFDVWDYDVKLWQGPSKRMPYLNLNPTNQKGLLNTAYLSNYYGAIISNVSRYEPSGWIYPQKLSPGFIWYWVNENDCDGNYTKVNGGYSLSSWSPCSVFCGGDGVQVRTRTCDSPAPRCGGNPCDVSVETREERSCKETCSATQVQTPDGHFCFEPKDGGCDPTDGTEVVLRPRPSAEFCKGEESLFVFNPNKGEITHLCSNKSVCFLNGVRGESLRISTQCPMMTPKSHFLRSHFDTLSFADSVVYPSGGFSEELPGGIGNGNTLILKRQSGQDIKEFFVFTNRTYNPGLNGDARCNFSSPEAPGDGRGGTEVPIKDVRGIDCINACIELKKKDDTVNGVTVTPYDRYCWCEKNMERRDDRKDLRSCFLNLDKPAGPTSMSTEDNKGPVKSLYWTSAGYDFFEEDERYPTKPTSVAFIDNLETPPELGYTYAFQLSSYFVPRQTGNYEFKASCENSCKLYLSDDEDPSKKKVIVDARTQTGRYEFDTYSYQSSDNIRLTSGKRYYIEVRFLQVYGSDHMEISVILPNGVFLEPITSDYLSR